MYKKLLTIAVAMLFIAFGKANAQFKMEAGKTDIAVRLGTGFSHTDKFSPYEKFNATSPAFGFTFETGAWNFGLSFGGEFNYATYEKDTKTATMTVLQGIVFVKYYPHINFSKFAPYGRVDLLPVGVFKISSPTSSGGSGAKSIYGFYGGVNYQFAERFGVFAEVGSGYTAVNGGLTWRIGDN